jgi:hypothetical protein
VIHVVSSRRSTCEGAKKLSEKDVDQHQRELAWEEGALKTEARLGGWDVRVGLAGVPFPTGSVDYASERR